MGDINLKSLVHIINHEFYLNTNLDTNMYLIT